MAVVLAACAPHALADADEEEALSAKGVAGEILDTAVEHCRRGEQAQALSMLQAIRTQLAPPPAILRLIQDLEATGCVKQATNAGALRVQVGTGWDSNVSQGISARSLVLGSGEDTLELELDDSYRPRASAFAQASLDYTFSLPSRGLTLQAALGHRKNARESSFDLTTLSGSASKDFALAGQPLRAQFDLAEIWLGGHRYQQTQGGTLQWAKAGEKGSWLATLGLSRVDYRTQPAQNARLVEAALLREQRLHAAAVVYGGASLQYDKASGTRPGGDRKGFQLQAGALILAYGWRFKPQIVRTSWDSEDFFAPGLLDLPRRNRLNYASFLAEKPLSSKSSLALEWRGRWARDSIALYRYTAHTVTATLSHRF